MRIIKVPVIRQVLLTALFVALVSTIWALNTGPRQIAHFEREALRCAREVLTQPGNHAGNAYVVDLNNQTIRETVIKRAKIAFTSMTTRNLDEFKAGNFDFSTLKQSGRIEVLAFIDAAAIKELISREVRRASAKHRIFDSVRLQFAADQVRVSGKIDMKKVPGNPFMFLPQNLSPFNVTVSVRAVGSQLMLDIISGEMNGQPFTPELNRIFLDWLNPLWDFAALPYPASLDYLLFSPDGVEFRGSLFK